MDKVLGENQRHLDKALAWHRKRLDKVFGENHQQLDRVAVDHRKNLDKAAVEHRKRLDKAVVGHRDLDMVDVDPQKLQDRAVDRRKVLGKPEPRLDKSLDPQEPAGRPPDPD